MTEMIRTMAQFLLLPILIVGAAILVKGYADTGDGFSAGVVVSTAVLLQYLAYGYDRSARAWPVKYAPQLAFSGLLIALLASFQSLLRGEAFFSHTPAPDAEVIKLGSLELHTAVLFDLGVFCIVVGFVVHLMSLIAQAYWGEDRDQGSEIRDQGSGIRDRGSEVSGDG